MLTGGEQVGEATNKPIRGCAVVYSDFHNLVTNNIIKKCLLKSFSISRFLRICSQVVPKNTVLIYVLQKIVFLFYIWVSKYWEFYADFKSMEILWKKCSHKKLLYLQKTFAS